MTSIYIDGKDHRVSVGKPIAGKNNVSYRLAFADLPDVSMTAQISGTLTYKLTDIKDPDKQVHRILVPNLDLVSVTGTHSQMMAADISVDRGKAH